jgi:uncharacterized protein (DUF488 family)
VGEAGEILTVGHSNREESEFGALVTGAGIELIADVRRYPSSRRLPHFERSALAASLKVAGIDYEWMGETLGGRREPEAGSANDAWENEQFRGYADHMAGDEFSAGLEQLERMAGERRTAILCAEEDWHHCHRRLIADALTARNWSVLHLSGTGGLEEHELTGSASVEKGRVTYPAAQTSLDL